MSTPRFDRQRRKLLIWGGTTVLLSAGLRAQTRSPRRIIAVGGALAEIVYALGAQNSPQSILVGADTTCTYPTATHALPKVGYERALSAEGLLSLRPDLVLASAEAGPPVVFEQIQQAGLAVIFFPEHHDIDSVRGKISGIAIALAVADAGRVLLAQFDRDWAQMRAAIDAQQDAKHVPAPRVLFVLNQTGNQAMVAGQHTAADAILSYAGARNAMQGFNGYRPLSAEALVAAAPDIILTTDEGLVAAGGPTSLLSSPGFDATPAGRAKRVISLDTLLLLGFGPRLPAAVTELRQSLQQA